MKGGEKQEGWSYLHTCTCEYKLKGLTSAWDSVQHVQSAPSWKECSRTYRGER